MKNEDETDQYLRDSLWAQKTLRKLLEELQALADAGFLL